MRNYRGNAHLRFLMVSHNEKRVSLILPRLVAESQGQTLGSLAVVLGGMDALNLRHDQQALMILAECREFPRDRQDDDPQKDRRRPENEPISVNRPPGGVTLG